MQDGNYRAPLRAERLAFGKYVPHQSLTPELRQRLQAAHGEHPDVLTAEARVADREHAGRHDRAVSGERFDADRAVRNSFSHDLSDAHKRDLIRR